MKMASVSFSRRTWTVQIISFYKSNDRSLRLIKSLFVIENDDLLFCFPSNR
jgi:hypothetical protein